MGNNSGKMGKVKDEITTTTQKDKERVEDVVSLLKKQSPPLTLKQEKFCNNGCVERFLKHKGDNVKKAAKHLRTCLSWRDSFAIDYLMADEFSAELSEGIAYVAGYDEESRPVMMFRIKQDYHKLHSQKTFNRLLVFTLEVAVQTMAKDVEQFIILFDASFFRSASAFMNILLATLKVIAEYYPGRLHKTFIIDPPSLFSYIWKGMRPFIELSPLTMVVYSLDFEESLDYNFKNSNYKSCRRASSLRYDPSSIPSTVKIGSSSSSRFSFAISQSIDSLKPWHLTLTDTSASKVGPTSEGPTLITSLNGRSYSFSSPTDRTPPGNIGTVKSIRRSFFPSTPMPEKTHTSFDHASIIQPRTPNPSSFFQSPAALFFKKDSRHVSRMEKSGRESFIQYLKFYRRPYDEMTYRSKMRLPLGGLTSIVPSQLKRRHVSVSQRF